MAGEQPSDGGIQVGHPGAVWARLASSRLITVVGRLVLGILFVWAAVGKIEDPGVFAASIENYRIVNPAVAMIIASILPWIELLCGLCILSGALRPGATLLAAAMLMIFTLAILSALARGLDITCGCLTQDADASKIGWTKVVENLVLTVLAVFLTTSRLCRCGGYRPGLRMK